MSERSIEKRLGILFLVFMGLLVIIIGRLWYLQMIKGEHYAHLADGNRMRQLRLMPPRGEILDRNGVVLVRSKPSFTVSLVPGGLPQGTTDSVALLCLLLDLDPQELDEAVQKGKEFPYESARIKRDVDAETVVAVEENRFNLPGIFIEEEPVREYLYGDLGAHLLGHLGVISPSELNKYGISYRGSDLVGKSGIEQTYEEILRGEMGTRTVEVNALSRPIRTVNVLEPVPGHNIILTIDSQLQAVAERTFLEHILTLEEEPGTQTGGVLALNPQNGEILVMASLPSFEPSSLIDEGKRNSYYNALSQDERRPFFNRVTQALYGPGSTFKPITALAILEEGVLGSADKFNATGVSQYGIKDWVISSNLAPFGWITMYDAIGVSSNHYFADNGVKVGIDRLSKWMDSFGFGTPTGLRLFPEEAKGLLPSKDWKKETFKNRVASEQSWYPTDTEQISIGQGFHQMTLLQLAQAYAGIANRGDIFLPHVVKEIQAPDGSLFYQAEPELARRVEAQDETWDALLQALLAPIQHPRGTARAVMSDFPIPVAGKTGTWEVPGSISNGLFIAFAPLEEPEILVAVVVERGGGGASAAGPIARAVLDAYFQLEPSEK